MRLFVLIGIAFSFSGLVYAAEQPSFQLPTATEVFHLRSECAALGEKIMNENAIGKALTQSVYTRYNPKTNRCYVHHVVQTADLSTPEDKSIFHDYLLDGQTKEMLATHSVERGKRSGIVYDLDYRAKRPNDWFGDAAEKYIEDMMMDDRKQ
jgi:hypothetical protein